MKTTTLAMIAVAAFLIFTMNAFGQQYGWNSSKSAEENATIISDRLKSNLSLSDDQYSKVYEFALTHAREMDNNKEMYRGSGNQKCREMNKQSRETFHKSVEGILTKEQLEKLSLLPGWNKDKKSEDKNRQ